LDFTGFYILIKRATLILKFIPASSWKKQSIGQIHKKQHKRVSDSILQAKKCVNLKFRGNVKLIKTDKFSCQVAFLQHPTPASPFLLAGAFQIWGIFWQASSIFFAILKIM